MAMPPRKYKKRYLTLSDGVVLPSSVPLMIPDNVQYDQVTNKLTKRHRGSRDKLVVTDIGRRLLQSIKEKPVAVLSICGPYRTGKSYILSRTIGDTRAFELGHEMEACTIGIWMGTTVLECDDFVVVMLDTEGICATSAKASDDTKILVMTVLLSSLFIYNSTRIPESRDLETMACFAHLSKSILVRDGFKEEDALGQFQHYFPDFIWLLRDVLLRIPKDKTTGRQLTPTQFLKNRVLKVSGSDQPTVADNVAEAICAFFPSLECRMLPPPSDDPDIMEDIEGNEHRLAVRFNEGVVALVSYIKQNIRGKTGLSRQQEANGVMLAMLMDKFIQAINQPGAIPNLDNAWQHVIMQKAESIVADLANEYKEEMGQTVTSLLPMEEEIIDGAEDVTSLMGIHRSILESKIRSLEEQLQHVIPLGTTIGDKSSVEARKQLTAILITKIAEYEHRQLTIQKPDGSIMHVTKKVVTGGILFQFSQDNYQKSHDYCTKLFDDLYRELNGKIITCDPNYTFEHFESELKQVQMTYSREAVGPAKWAVQKQMNDQIFQQEAQFKRMKGFQKQALELMKEAQATATESDKLRSDVASLQTQLSSEKDAQEQRFRRLQEQTRQDMATLQNENDEKFQRLEDHNRELLNANMDRAAQANAAEIAELRFRTQKQEEQIQRDIDRARAEKEKQEGVLNSWGHALESAGKAIGKTAAAPFRLLKKGWDWLTSD